MARYFALALLDCQRTCALHRRMSFLPSFLSSFCQTGQVRFAGEAACQSGLIASPAAFRHHSGTWSFQNPGLHEAVTMVGTMSGMEMG